MVLLSQDLVKVHRQKRQEGARLALEAYAFLMSGDPVKARQSIIKASEVAPYDKNISKYAAWFNTSIATFENGLAASPPEVRTAYRLAGHGLYSLSKGDYAAGVKNLETASSMSPGDPLITTMLDEARKKAGGK
jgi:hypothetical protein